MFNKLVASEGRKSTGFWSPQNVVVSVLLHVLIVGGAVAAGVGDAAMGKTREELVEFIDIEEEPTPEAEVEPEPPPPPPPDEPAAPPPVAKGFQTLVPPTEPPPTIAAPDPSQQAVNVEDFSGIGKEGGVAKGVETGVAQSTVERTAPVDQGTYELHAVEEHPRPTNLADLQRTMQRNYPPLLRDAGVQGTVQVRFRVLEDGRVDGESISVSASTHDQFNDPTIRAVRGLRFRPARVNNRPVRVWVELPVQWTVPR
jgi:periplasmic protein TonB